VSTFSEIFRVFDARIESLAALAEPPHPLAAIFRAAEKNAGLAVEDAASLMAWARDPERRVVFIGIASTNNPVRQRSTLAHELAHVLFEDWSDLDAERWDERTPEEIRADAFARHLLVPQRGLKSFLNDREVIDVAALSAVVQHFLVSPSLAAIAMEEAGFISPLTKAEWSGLTTPALAARFGWSDQYRALQSDSSQRRAPQRLLARAVNGYVEQVVSLRTLAALRGCDAEVVEAELRDAGIEAPEVDIRWASAADLPDLELDLTDLEEGDEATSG